MKKKLSLLWAIAVFTMASAWGQSSHTVHVTTPGTLSTLVTKPYVFSDLIITGTIDSTDLVFIRDDIGNLKSMDLSGSVIVDNRIPTEAFESMMYLTTFISPPTVTEIGKYAFCWCEELLSVTFPSSLITIEWGAFEMCMSLAEINLPSTLQTIFPLAFSNCIALTEIEIPASVKNLEDAFNDCINIISYHVDENNSYYCGVEDVLFNKSKTRLVAYPFASSRIEYSIPSTVDTVVNYAFAACAYLETIIVPSSVKSLGYIPFSSCYKLSAILVDDSNIYYSDIDGILFNKDKTRLIRYPSKTDNSYLVPEGVTIIDDLAFNFSPNLASVLLKNDITYIGMLSFMNCHALTSVHMPSSLDSIGEGAFNFCDQLRSLKFAPPLDSIPVRVFYRCSSLTSVTIPSTAHFLSYTNLQRCTSLESIIINASDPIKVESKYSFFNIDTENSTIYVPSGSLEAYRNAPFWNSFDHIEEFDFSLLTSGNEFAVGAPAGSDTSFTITSNTEWSLSASQNWLHMDRLLGMDSDTVVISADANPSGNAREATVTVTGLGTDPITITVTQAAGPTAIKHAYDSRIRVYPNPVTDKLFITGCAGVHAEIYNLDGKLVLSKELVQDTETVDMQSLAAGTYLLKLGDHQYKISK